MDEIVEEILAERRRQKSLGLGGDTARFDRTSSKNDWIAYIQAYTGRAADKVERNERERCDFRENLIKAAALVVAAIEAHDADYC